MRARQFASGVFISAGSSQALLASELAPVQLDAKGSVDRYKLDAEPGSYLITPGTADLRFEGTPPALVERPPELVLSFVVLGNRTDEGSIILAVTPVWRRFLDQLANDPSALNQLDWRQAEELVAGTYREDGWTVELTPAAATRGATLSPIETTSGQSA